MKIRMSSRDMGVMLLAWAALMLTACDRATPVPTVFIATATPSATSALPTAAAPEPTTSPVAIISAAAAVPAEYRALYKELDASMSAFMQTLPASSGPAPIFGAELLTANANRGPDLLTPQNLQATRLYLDRLYALGVRGVTFPVSYPVLTPDFPRYTEYLQFFKSVAQEVHQRGMALSIETGPVFPPPFSSLPVNYAGLTVDKFKATKRQMVVTIIENLKPEYLDLGAEPDTESSILHLTALNDPQQHADVINFILKDLPRGGTKIGAGVGTWASPEFARRYAAETSLDFIAVHIYPVMPQALQNAVTVADIARQYNKRLVMDEAWLYKMHASERPENVAANSDIFRRDVYSFWAPLDQKFLALIMRLARARGFDYVSPFWSTLLFASLDYDATLEKLPYNELAARLNQQATRNLIAGTYSPTGEYYRRLIAGLP